MATMQTLTILFYLLLVALLSYAVGSLSFAVIVSRVMGLGDPRSYGSKNPGATNVLRSGNKLAAIITLVLDAMKGWLPVFLLQQYGERLGLGDGAVALAGLSAFLGHLYPVFFRFKGGKGVATAAGVLVGVHPLLGLACGLVWILVATLSRYSSLAALFAAVAAPSIYILASGELWFMGRAQLAALIAMSALLFYRHRENIIRLVQGRESQLGAPSDRDLGRGKKDNNPRAS